MNKLNELNEQIATVTRKLGVSKAALKFYEDRRKNTSPYKKPEEYSMWAKRELKMEESIYELGIELENLRYDIEEVLYAGIESKESMPCCK